MDIAIVFKSLRAVGGAENVVVRLSDSLAGRGHSVCLFTSDFSEEVWGRTEERGYSTHLLARGPGKIHSTWKNNRDSGRALADALARRRFDVVNAHNYPANLWVHYAKEKNIDFPPTIYFLHNLPAYLYEEISAPHLRMLPGLRNRWKRNRPKWWFRILRQRMLGYQNLDQAAVRSFDRVVANSGFCASLAASVYGRNVELCLLGVALDPPAGNVESEGFPEPKTPGAEPVVLTVARLEPQKNLDTLLEAIRILKFGWKGTVPRFRFVIAGAGPLLDHLRARSQRLGIEDVTYFPGSVPHDRIRTLYGMASFLVHIPLDEPFGLVPLEAALCGKTSIVSDHGGPAEVVADGVNGLHANALDPGDVAEKIGRLLGDPSAAGRMGVAAYSRACREYSWDRFVNEFEDYLIRTVRCRDGKAIREP